VDQKKEAPGTIHLIFQDNFGIVEKKILKTGHGRKPEKGQKVTIRGSGRLKSGGKEFWSTKVLCESMVSCVVLFNGFVHVNT
jgi:hypothetical protein